jgi:hypothetical protein
MKDLKHLKTFEQYSLDTDNTTETNEKFMGIGMSNEEKQLIDNLAAKGKLEETDIDALMQKKLISKIMDSFSLSNPGTHNGNAAIAKKKEIIANPKGNPDIILNFIKVYSDSLKNSKVTKFYGLDRMGKLYAKTGNVAGPSGLHSAVGSY